MLLACPNKKVDGGGLEADVVPLNTLLLLLLLLAETLGPAEFEGLGFKKLNAGFADPGSERRRNCITLQKKAVEDTEAEREGTNPSLTPVKLVTFPRCAYCSVSLADVLWRDHKSCNILHHKAG